jgi:lysophospholipase L1-like esterase
MVAGKSSWKINLLLVIASLALIALLTFGVDFAAGKIMPEVSYTGRMELIFPPGNEQEFRTTDFTYTARINNWGLREREIAPERDGKYRILAIGDSFTYGWGVESEQTWLRLMEERMVKDGYNVETINCGKPGEGPPFYATLAEKVIPLFKPDLVIVGMLMGDDVAAAGPEGLKPAEGWLMEHVRRLYPNLTRIVEMRGRAADGQPAAHQPGKPSKSTAEDNRRYSAKTAKDFLDKMSPEERGRFDGFEDKVKKAYLDGLLNPYMVDLAMKNKNFYANQVNLDDPWNKGCIERTGAHMLRIKKVAERCGAKVAVVSIPPGMYVNDAALKNIARVGYETKPEMVDSDAVDAAIKMACDSAGLPFYSVTKAFKDRRADPSLYFELDYHLNVNGHKFYAEQIAPIIEKVVGDKAKK